MRKKSKQLFSLLIITLLLGSLISSSAMAKGDRPVRLDSRGTFQTEAGIQSTTEMTLQESTDQSVWTNVYGNAATGYTMILDPANQYEYLDVSSITPTPADDDYPFVLDPVRVPAGFYEYWALKGVVETATAGTWQAYMWEIINGDLPMFYLRVSGTSYDLIDGLMYAMATDPASVTDKLKVNGDYPLHTYNFEGTIGTETFVIGITFTRAVTPSLRIDGTEIETLVIDGCGYVDVTIHLENVYNLYAVDLSLTFNPEFVEVMDQGSGLAGVNLLPLAPWDDPATAYTVSNLADNSAGTIRFIASLLNTQAPITGSLDVATIRLRAKALGESMLSITGMELSDRDGYLVGLPLTTSISYPVTTQFTAAGGLDLGITRLDASTVQLNWPAQTMDEVETFTLHRSTLPYFTPDTSTVYATIPNDDGTVATYDDAVLGNVVDNYFYTMQITCDSGLESPYAWQVGKFEYQLYESFEETDFTFIGLVLESTLQPPLEYASDLEQHIEQYSNGSVDVLTISEWNEGSQQFTLYPEGNFQVEVGSVYQVEISTDYYAGTIWAQVGKLPPKSVFTYTLYELFEETDFTWILQPLDFTSIHDAITLASDIESNSSELLTVLTISEWASNQSFTLYDGSDGSNFSTRFGYPYMIEVFYAYDGTYVYPVRQ